jgi:hypothetical protein
LPWVLGTQRHDGTLGQVHFVTDGDSVYLSTQRDRQKAHDIADVTAGILATDDDLAAMNRVLIPTSTTSTAPPTSLAGKTAS